MIVRSITLLLLAAALPPSLHSQTLAELWGGDQRPERVEADARIEMALAIGTIEELGDRPHRIVRLVELPVLGDCVDITHRYCGSRYLLVLSEGRHFPSEAQIWDLGYLGKVFDATWTAERTWWDGELVLEVQNWHDEIIEMQGTIAALESLARQTKTLRYRVSEDSVELMR